MSGIPDYPLGETLDFKFTTRSFSTGAPATLAGTPAVEVYEDNDVAQITAGITLSADFDGVTGLNNVRIVATSGNGYEAGKSYAAVISVGTVGGVSVVGEVVAQFTIERSPALRPTTAGRTLDVTATGEAGIDLDNTSGTLAAAQIATGAITAAKFAAGAIDAAALATDAAQEIRDAILPPINTALSDILFLMVDSTDHFTPKTGLTITATRSIDGAAFGAATGTAAEIGNGIYQFDASAADMNGSMIVFRFTGTAADDTFVVIRTGG